MRPSEHCLPGHMFCLGRHFVFSCGEALLPTTLQRITIFYEQYHQKNVGREPRLLRASMCNQGDTNRWRAVGGEGSRRTAFICFSVSFRLVATGYCCGKACFFFLFEFRIWWALVECSMDVFLCLGDGYRIRIYDISFDILLRICDTKSFDKSLYLS